MEIKQMSSGALAFVGDAVWSLKVRDYLVLKGYQKPNDLQKLSIRFVSAKAQASFIRLLEEKQWMSPAENEVYHRGRNYKSETKAKNADIVTYRIATGFEALVGYLYLMKEQERLEQLWNLIETEMEKTT